MDRATKIQMFLNKNLLRKSILPSRLTSCNLHDLPLELLLIVTSDLSPQDICALSLVCRSLFLAFKSSNPFQWTNCPEQKRTFLTLIEQDLPGHLLCFSCNLLYKWKSLDSKDPRLCPNRDSRPHLTYSHLDFEHHERSVEREIVDLAYRHFFHGPTHGVPLSYLLGRLQAKELLDGSLRMPAVSLVSGYWREQTLVIETELEIRVNIKDDSHPLNPFIYTKEPEKWTEASHPSIPPNFNHKRLSAITRRLGCNVHENRERFESLGENGEWARFYRCKDCRSSVQISTRTYRRTHRILVIKTSQNMGSGREPLDERTGIAHLRRSHQARMPEKECMNLRCGGKAPAEREKQPAPLCVVTPQNKSDKPEDKLEVSLQDDLGVAAWFKRHSFHESRRIWLDNVDSSNCKLTGWEQASSRRKYLVPWLLWELPTAILWHFPKIFIWDIPKIFVWEWPRDVVRELRREA